MNFVAKTLKRAAIAALGVAGISTSVGAQSDQHFFDYYCISGSFQVCASVRLFSDNNTLRMQVWNLDGLVGGAHTITALGLYHQGPFIDWQSKITDWSVWYNGSNTWNGKDLKTYWSKKNAEVTETQADDIKTLAGIDLELSEGTSANNGIVGCTELDGGTKWATCFPNDVNSFDGQPYMEFRFTFGATDYFSLDGVELRWHSQQVGPDREESLKCDTGGAGDYPPCTAVPEPTTIVLLGSGMAGLAAAHRRRRKKDLV